MNLILSMPIPVRLLITFVLGAFVGGQINRGIYRLAIDRRQIGPWSPPLPDALPRKWTDRIPIFGWLGQRRESVLHGKGFWVRPLLIEIGVGIAFALLYWWEVLCAGLHVLRAGQPPFSPSEIHLQYLCHIILISLMTVATFIDFDEKTIPDEITLPGVLLACVLAGLAPNSLLPISGSPRGPIEANMVSTLHYASPLAFENWIFTWRGLLCGWVFFAGWLFAILPRLWITRRGLRKACAYFVEGIRRYTVWNWFFCITLGGFAWITGIWYLAGYRWLSLFSSLAGMAFGGAMIWSVRLVAGRALSKEAMGFGDVTLMSMIGAFLGWQPSLLIFVMAPMVAVFVALIQCLSTRRKDIAFGPYLCLAALLVIVQWPRVWQYADSRLFSLGAAPVLVGSFTFVMAVGGMLTCWVWIRDRIFPLDDPGQE